MKTDTKNENEDEDEDEDQMKISKLSNLAKSILANLKKIAADATKNFVRIFFSGGSRAGPAPLRSWASLPCSVVF